MSISVASDDDDDGEAVRIDKIFLKSRGSKDSLYALWRDILSRHRKREQNIACCSLFFDSERKDTLHSGGNRMTCSVSQPLSYVLHDCKKRRCPCNKV